MGLDIPVLNLGPSGKDPHRPTERLCLSYSLDIFPILLREAVVSLGLSHTDVGTLKGS